MKKKEKEKKEKSVNNPSIIQSTSHGGEIRQQLVRYVRFSIIKSALRLASPLAMDVAAREREQLVEIVTLNSFDARCINVFHKLTGRAKFRLGIAYIVPRVFVFHFTSV